MQTYITQVKV